MSVSKWIDSGAMLDGIKAHMNEEMMAAAEPVIKRAVEAAEVEMRKRLAQTFVAMIDENFVVERYGTDLRIVISHRPITG